MTASKNVKGLILRGLKACKLIYGKTYYIKLSSPLAPITPKYGTFVLFTCPSPCNILSAKTYQLVKPPSKKKTKGNKKPLVISFYSNENGF